MNILHCNFDSCVYFPAEVMRHPNGSKSYYMPPGYKNFETSVTEPKKSDTHWVIRTGSISEVTVIDIDDMDYYYSTDLEDLLENSTFCDESFSGKRHFYFQYEPSLKNRQLGYFDVLNDSKTATLGKPLNDLPIQKMPETTLNWFKEYISRQDNQNDEYEELANLMTAEYVKVTYDWKQIGKYFKLLGATFESWDIVSRKDRTGYNKPGNRQKMKELWASWPSVSVLRQMIDDFLVRERMERNPDKLSEMHKNAREIFGILKKKTKRNHFHDISDMEDGVTRRFRSQGLVDIATRINDPLVIRWLVQRGLVEKSFDIVKINSFDLTDQYYFNDFMLALTDQDKIYWKSELLLFIAENISRVVCFLANGTILIKESDVNQFALYPFERLPESSIKVRGAIINPHLKKIIVNEFSSICYKLNYKMFDACFRELGLESDVFYACQDFVAKPIKSRSLGFEKLINFIKRQICSNNEEVYKFLMSWISFIWKYPNQKSEIAIVLHGKPGCGKTQLCNFLVKFLFGSSICKPNLEYSDLVGVKNANLMGKKLVIVNELADLRSEKSKNQQKLKSLITEDQIEINKMYCDKVTCSNRMEFIFTTNNDNCLKLDQQDRRYFMITVNDEYRNDKVYFGDLINSSWNQNTANEFADFLDNFISNQQEFKELEIPTTKIREEALIRSIWDSPFYEALRESGTAFCDYVETDEGRLYKRAELYSKYKDWMNTNGLKPNSNIRFKSDLIQYEIATEKAKKVRGQTVRYFLVTGCEDQGFESEDYSSTYVPQEIDFSISGE